MEKQNSPGKSEYSFPYEWKTVVRAFWDKYPNEMMDFIKYNQVVDIDILEDGKLQIQRIQKAQKWRYLWAYSLEKITFDFENKIMDLTTIPLKKCSLIPIGGIETIRYSAYQDLIEKCEKTLYTKSLAVKGTMTKFVEKFNDGFKKGCDIVEKNCEEFKNMALQEWNELINPEENDSE